MKFSAIDIGIVISYVVFAIGLAIYYSKRASQNINEYFVSGRNLISTKSTNISHYKTQLQGRIRQSLGHAAIQT